MGGGLESRCVGRVYGADGAVRHHPQVHHVRIPHYLNINVLTFSRKFPDIFVRISSKFWNFLTDCITSLQYTIS